MSAPVAARRLLLVTGNRDKLAEARRIVTAVASGRVELEAVELEGSAVP